MLDCASRHNPAASAIIPNMVVLVVFVVGTFLKDNPQALNLMKWAGVFYIIYLAYDTYTAKIGSIKSKTIFKKSKLSFYKDGFLVAGLSPKAIIFFSTIFISFIDFSSNYYSQFLILMTTYVVLDFLTLMIYGLAAKKISNYLKNKPKLLNTISACVLIFIALFIGVNQNY